MASLVSICTFGLLVSTTLGYNIIRDYSGSTFFDGWDFYGAPDNLTLGMTDGFAAFKTHFHFFFLQRECQLGLAGGGNEPEPRICE